jgi:hypothetical protein
MTDAFPEQEEVVNGKRIMPFAVNFGPPCERLRLLAQSEPEKKQVAARIRREA